MLQAPGTTLVLFVVVNQTGAIIQVRVLADGQELFVRRLGAQVSNTSVAVHPVGQYPMVVNLRPPCDPGFHRMPRTVEGDLLFKLCDELGALRMGSDEAQIPSQDVNRLGESHRGGDGEVDVRRGWCARRVPEPTEVRLPRHPQPSSAGFLVGEQAMSNEKLINDETFPNQKAGLNECVPAALSNSLKWLNKKHNLGMKDEDLSIASMKKAVKWQPTGAGEQWASLKKKFRPDLITTTTQQIEEVVKAFERKCDVELEAGDHVAALVGITRKRTEHSLLT